MSVRRLKVRCCCTPTKVYGTLPIPNNARVGMCVHYPLRSDGPFSTLSLEVARFGPMPRLDDELALKYEGDDKTFEEKLEVLKRVPGFKLESGLS